MTAPVWSNGARALYQRDLRQYGVTIGECSDMLEVLGLPRLSASTPAQRAKAPTLLLSHRGQETLAYVRESRRAVLAHLKASGRTVVRVVRERLELGVPSGLRLGELLDLYAAVLVLEVETDTVREAA